VVTAVELFETLRGIGESRTFTESPVGKASAMIAYKHASGAVLAIGFDGHVDRVGLRIDTVLD